MSLTVTPDVVEAAERGELTLDAFVEVVRTSLPYFYDRVEKLAHGVTESGIATSNDIPGSDAEWNQMLRGFASDPIRQAMEEHFGITLGFRNCCFGGAVKRGSENQPAWQELFTQKAQVLAQTPELLNC